MRKSFENFSFSFCFEIDPQILCHIRLIELFNDFKKIFSDYYVRSYFLKPIRTKVDNWKLCLEFYIRDITYKENF